MPKKTEAVPKRVGVFSKTVPVRYWFDGSDQFYDTVEQAKEAFLVAKMTSRNAASLYSYISHTEPLASALIYACVPVVTLTRDNGVVMEKVV